MWNLILFTLTAPCKCRTSPTTWYLNPAIMIHITARYNMHDGTVAFRMCSGMCVCVCVCALSFTNSLRVQSFKSPMFKWRHSFRGLVYIFVLVKSVVAKVRRLKRFDQSQASDSENQWTQRNRRILQQQVLIQYNKCYLISHVSSSQHFGN